MATEREQKLVDLVFSISQTISDPSYRRNFDSMSRDGRMAWVAKQLRECGFETKPIGSSWGVLVDSKPSYGDC